MTSAKLRRMLVVLHRYVGLALTPFLLVVGLTGSLLAFQPELNRLLTPQLFPAAAAGHPLDLAALAERAERLVPQAHISLIDVGTPETVLIRLTPHLDPVSNMPVVLDFSELFLDPVSGAELGRRLVGSGLPTGIDNLMPFVFRLHYNLSLSELGAWVLGIAALLWTIDCLVSVYLTLPTGSERSQRHYWIRWQPAWRVKWPATSFRINFDLHRAGGLWTWLALLIFAWSSVYMNLHDQVYAPTTRLALDYPPPYWELPPHPAPPEQAAQTWRQAVRTAERLMAEQSHLHGFTVEQAVALRLDRARHQFVYTVRSSRDIQARRGRTRIVFDAATGDFKQLQLPTGQHSGTTVTLWLNALHDANVAILGLPYRIFVSVLGLVITMLSLTGIYLWWEKRRARAMQAGRAKA